MSNSKHQSIIYSEDSRYDNYIDPITKNPFKNGEQVVVCKEKNSLLASRSLKANDNQCPFCGKQLNRDLTIDGPIPSPIYEGGKPPKRPSSPPPSSPNRSNTSSLLWIGVAAALIFCFVLTVSWFFASIISVGGTDNPAPVSSTARPTATKSSQTPRPTNTQYNPPSIQPTKTPKNSKKYAEISCAEIYKVNLRRTPGYVGKNDNTDSLYEIPCGEFVEILGPTRKVDGLTWWNVYWNGYTGWVADHTGSGKVILDFNP